MESANPSSLFRLGDYLRMIKFSHSLFALPFAGIAIVSALPESKIEFGSILFYRLLFLVIICMVSLRSAAMGFNRIADRTFDAANPRTSIREIPSGKISVASVRAFVVISLIIFFLSASLISPLCGILSPVAAAFVLGYSYTKRFTWLCHFFLGLSIGMAPAATTIAILGYLTAPSLLWSAGLALYIAGFDILYSCQDAEFDSKKSLHSVPSRFGIPVALFIARTSHVFALCLFILAATKSGSGPLFFVFLVIVAALFVTEHVLVRPGKLEKVPIAFFHINASISGILFAGMVADILFKNWRA